MLAYGQLFKRRSLFCRREQTDFEILMFFSNIKKKETKYLTKNNIHTINQQRLINLL